MSGDTIRGARLALSLRGLKGPATLSLIDERTGDASSSSAVLDAARTRIVARCDSPKFLSGPFRSRAGSFLVVDLDGLDATQRTLVAEQLLDVLGPLVESAELSGSKVQQGPFARRRFTAETPDNVVLVVRPKFDRPRLARDGVVADEWIVALGDALGGLGWRGQSFDCLLAGIRYERVPAGELAGFLLAAVHGGTDALVCTTDDRVPLVRTTGSHRLAVAAPANSPREASDAVGRLRDFAVRLPHLGYSYIDIVRDVSPLVRGYYQAPDLAKVDGWAGEDFCDERVPDAFAWQMLNSAHLAWLGPDADALALRELAGMFECSFGTPEGWWEERASRNAPDSGGRDLDRPLHRLGRSRLDRLVYYRDRPADGEYRMERMKAHRTG